MNTPLKINSFSLKISELAPFGRFEQRIFSTLHSLIFLTLHLQGHKLTLENSDNLKYIDYKSLLPELSLYHLSLLLLL
ncbi:hypothetical protein [Capnocytophaga canimorsus]|uniref:hypothetical protein n=1 Tax=Capnocytophaga canimorsus TaxID=28188 RepID=UPI0013A5B620|nr:hypothetical protein [Capnocytophaga canimorsus]MDT9498622.1 hypothetical protein [Capnocytophaga canimorsus]